MALLDWPITSGPNGWEGPSVPLRLDVVAGFTPLPSNQSAITLIEAFIAGRIHSLWLGGPTGGGKSVLLDTVTQVFRNNDVPVRHESALSFARLLSSPYDDHANHSVLILDDFQDVRLHPRQAAAITNHLEHRVRRGLPTIVGDTVRRPLPSASLPLMTRWERIWLPVPQGEERERLVQHMAGLMRLHLDPVLVKIIAYRMGGNHRAIAGALQRLAVDSGDWRGRGRTLTACARLMPLISIGTEWDPRDAFAEGVERALSHLGEQERQNWVAWSLLRGARFVECDVAAYLDRDPGEVFLMAQSAVVHLSKRSADKRWTLVKQRVFDLISREIGS
ncbi:MAG: hypothetical protein KF812_06860 [Fimbriimonadaceae bacterium]|nr:hypothetical protein [Fimbriimonadaceae bacterium]